MHPARLLSLRETKFVQTHLENVAEDGSFSGYASLFNKPDLGNDIVMPGAFRASLQRRGVSGVRMLFQHDPAQPIGVWKNISEDSAGLRVSGCLAMSVGRGREVYELLRAGAVDGLSIGFRTLEASRDRKAGLRRITKADLWEISVVTFPMQPEARIDAMTTPGMSHETKHGVPAQLASRIRQAAATLRNQINR